jgi:endonuclease/exonuclease/phosphatase family metal-dependent hydrolase
MRLVSYNILNGGEGRADPLAEVLLAQKADIVVLVEADDQAVLDRISSRLDMDCIHGPGNRHASAILSRWPIRSSINQGLLHPQISKSLLEAEIVDPTGGEWTVAAVHLHERASDADESRREVELAVLLRLFEKARSSGRPHLIAGDFNSNAPSQIVDPARCKPRTREEWEANGGRLPRRVVQSMLRAGYRDTLAEAAPESATTLGTFTTQFPGQRVDYIFAHGYSKDQIRSAWVEQDRLAKYASDHFPVGVEIRSGDSR